METTTSKQVFKNPMRISIAEWRDLNGLADDNDFDTYCENLVIDSVCPVMCRECDEVEPDGRCEHGCPSLFLAMGVI